MYVACLFGLLGMEERVRRLGGRLEIDSHLGRGTLARAELPVAELAGERKDPAPAIHRRDAEDAEIPRRKQELEARG
jgi:hypothetical protein